MGSRSCSPPSHSRRTHPGNRGWGGVGKGGQGLAQGHAASRGLAAGGRAEPLRRGGGAPSPSPGGGRRRGTRVRRGPGCRVPSGRQGCALRQPGPSSERLPQPEVISVPRWGRAGEGRGAAGDEAGRAAGNALRGCRMGWGPALRLEQLPRVKNTPGPALLRAPPPPPPRCPSVWAAAAPPGAQLSLSLICPFAELAAEGGAGRHPEGDSRRRCRRDKGERRGSGVGARGGGGGRGRGGRRGRGRRAERSALPGWALP